MKHVPIAIRFVDLVRESSAMRGLRRAPGDVSKALSFIGGRYTELAELLAEYLLLADKLLKLDAEIERRESDILDSMRDAWFRVTWPDDVTRPKYNEVATYVRCADKAEAMAGGAIEYGTSEGNG